MRHRIKTFLKQLWPLVKALWKDQYITKEYKIEINFLSIDKRSVILKVKHPSLSSPETIYVCPFDTLLLRFKTRIYL